VDIGPRQRDDPARRSLSGASEILT